jgi:hypothetical protein
MDHLEVKRVALDSKVDLASLADEVSVDKTPRVLERDGEPVAALVSIEDLRKLGPLKPTQEQIESAMNARWSMSDEEAEELKDRIYRQQHGLPPNAPVKR